MKLNIISLEGAAEEAIIDILLDNDMLIVSRDSLIENRPLRVRDANELCTYLQKDFDGTITIYRILDSSNERFNLSRENKVLFGDKIELINVITKPEIELLYILSQGKYRDYMKVKSHTKPSKFCKQDLKCRKIKEYEFVYSYFSDTNELVRTLKEYNRVTAKSKATHSLFDLLRTEYKK